MMELTDFNTLEEAHAYFESSERMVSQDMVVSMLTLYDSVVSLRDSQDSKAQGFWLAITSGVKEFNLMASHPVGQAQKQLLDDLLTVNAVTSDFHTAVYAYANPTIFPYKTVTQEEFDAAKYEQSISGVTNGVVSYGQPDSTQPFHVQISKSKISLRFDLPEPKEYDTEFIIGCHVRDDGEDSFSHLADNIYYAPIVIPAGKVSETIVLKESYGRHIQFEAKSNRKDPFTVLVKTR